MSNAVSAAARNLSPDDSPPVQAEPPHQPASSSPTATVGDCVGGDANEVAPVTEEGVVPAAPLKLVDSSSDDDNAVRRTVRELLDLSDANQELRSTLCALGVPRRMIQQMVEVGVQKQSDRQSTMIEAALEKAASENGETSLDRQTLVDGIAELVRIDQEVGHVRQLARGMGFDPRSLTILSQLIQSNPGDGGEVAVNTFLAYARACDIKLDGIAVMAANLTARPTSVLPNIPRKTVDSSPAARRRVLLRDIFVGLVISVVTIGLLI